MLFTNHSKNNQSDILNDLINKTKPKAVTPVRVPPLRCDTSTCLLPAVDGGVAAQRRADLDQRPQPV